MSAAMCQCAFCSRSGLTIPAALSWATVLPLTLRDRPAGRFIRSKARIDACVYARPSDRS
jgi:hypothetical protein